MPHKIGILNPWAANPKFLISSAILITVVFLIALISANSSSTGGASQPQTTGKTNFVQPAFPIQRWDMSAITNLPQPVTCVNLEENEWSSAYQAPASVRISIFGPGPHLDLWFSTGEMILDWQTYQSPVPFPSRIFRMRSRGGRGYGSIAYQNNN